MTDTDDVTLPAIRHLAGESEYICRLCFGATEIGVCLDESRHVKCHYYDDTVTFGDIMKELGVTNEPALPQILCECCADAAMNAFLFQKLCQQSNNKWHETIERFNKTLDRSNTIKPSVKTAYMLIESNLVLTSRENHEKRTKEEVLDDIQNLIKSKLRYQKNKKRLERKRLAVVCGECGERFSTSKHLAKHSMSKHNNKNYPCPKCTKVFISQKTVQAHSERVHGPKRFQCPKCAKMFTTESILKTHDSQYHKAVTCKRCSIQFQTQRELRMHRNRHNVHKCPNCNKEFHNVITFYHHKNRCGKDEKVLKYCDICNKSYTHKGGLQSHLIVAHGFGRVYSCNWCDKPFDSVSKMKMHTVKHTRERNFHCEQCGGQFVTRRALECHIRLHTGERPFPCDMCDESFLNASRRMEHKRRKHWGPSRECPICHSMFVTGHELKQHIARHNNPRSRLFAAENESNKNNSTKRLKVSEL